MKVEVDPVKCETIGICVRECPSYFSFEPGSKKAVTPEGEVPPHLVEKVKRAVEKCPNRAIRIVE
jgi:ferredoxin